MITHASYIDIEEFKKDFSTLSRHANEDGVLDGILTIINSVNRSISDFLRSADSIEDSKIQMLCRKAVIAQKYGAKLDYRSGYPYVETSSYSNDLLLLEFKESSAIVSKYGDIIVNEGEVYTHSGRFYGGGFVVTSVKDNKYGFISSSGATILPCIFDDCDMHVGEYNFIYKHVNFELMLFGRIDSIDKQDIQYMIEDYDERNVITCSSNNSIIFLLRQRDLLSTDYKYVGTDNGHKDVAIKDVKTLLSDRIISKDKLQEIYGD